MHFHSKVKHRSVLRQVRRIIEQVEAANEYQDVTGWKKITGHSEYYRIRCGDYRIGIVLNGVEMEFVRCLHRREVYRYFP
uniref:mRNA interferase RelE/StbE n=1 Tax=Candidatus Kentrum sp. DK TaxID=2126562 RepID=A0A450SWX3_9GAMM|nr:MAG: mRNA interferase RelE/StbE [Candidatus Kentron sp. DK]